MTAMYLVITLLGIGMIWAATLGLLVAREGMLLLQLHHGYFISMMSVGAAITLYGRLKSLFLVKGRTNV
jgi:hypothetical protein